MARRLILTAIITLIVPGLVAAQDVAQPELQTRLVNLPTHLALTGGTMQVLFTHRFTDTVSHAGAGNLYGLDSSADIGIGLAMGFGHGLDAEVYRSALFKEYEAALKWTALRQGRSFPLGVAFRFGSDYRAVSGLKDRWAGFAQVVIARRFGSSLDVFVVPTFVSDTPTLRKARNVGLGISLHLPHAWDIAGEAVPANRDVSSSHAAWAVGFVKRVPGHAFLIYFGNSRATTTDLIAGSDIPGGFNRGDVRLGFNLIRRFPE
ncbi:MAG: DUF5777 family beta-barrel protein [Acidobacteriia bacterium]|nr:DUF5777 family beta-barrel protein [Terriglobia bacterium]